MNILELAKKVGSSLIRAALPGVGGILIDTVNEFLPDNIKLPPSATGDEVQSAILQMPPDQQAALLTKQLDVDIKQIEANINVVSQSHETLRTMLLQDAVSPHSTRPKIAYQAFQTVAFVTIIIALGWLYAVVTKDTAMVETIQNGWAFIATLLTPFVFWLNSYFGILKTEQQNKLDAYNELPTKQTGITGLFKR